MALSKRAWLIVAVAAVFLAVLVAMEACHGLTSGGTAESGAASADEAGSGSSGGTGSSDVSDDGSAGASDLGSTGTGSSGGSGVSSGTVASGASGASATGESTGSGASSGSGITVCGGAAGVICDSDSWCDFGGSCGGGDAQGQCRPVGDGGPADCTHPVCGCDGKAYCNAWVAQMNGVGTTASTSCVSGDGGAAAPCMVDSDCQNGLSCCRGGASISALKCTKSAPAGGCLGTP